jgi:NitT/TauT family transport system permease protein
LVQALYFEQLPRIWLLIIVCGILGSLLYAAVALVGERYVWWRPE